jgi:uncharacterized Ntn-hydrolase superfamily protein
VTFSIVARDPRNGDLGIATASKFVAVGHVVPWAKAGVGAVATQAYANPTYGYVGLAMLERGLSAKEALEALLAVDELREQRQVGIVDSRGGVAAFTGKQCMEYAGHLVGDNYVVLGNILTGPRVLEAMVEAFNGAEGELVDKLLAALAAGDAAGGDRRGRQSAAILVVRAGGGYGGMDRYVDIRVDDHPNPVEELRRIFRIWDLTLLNRETEWYELRGEVLREVQLLLRRLGYNVEATGTMDEATERAYEEFIYVNNFENKYRRGLISRGILEYMRSLVK